MAELMEEVVGSDISDENVVCVGDIIDTSNQEGFLRCVCDCMIAGHHAYHWVDDAQSIYTLYRATLLRTHICHMSVA